MTRALRLVAWSTAIACFVQPPLLPARVASAAPATAPSPCIGADASVEEVVVKTEDGLALAGSLHLPSRSGRAPAVMIVHSPGADRHEGEAIAKGLAKRGLVVLALDLRGHGGSAGSDTAFATLPAEEQERMWTFALRDLVAGATFLRSRKEVHTTNLSLVGIGRSCGLALRHASLDENVRAIALVSPDEHQLGFVLAEEVQRCGGLPTMILTAKETRAFAARLIDGLGEEGQQTVGLTVLKSSADETLSDSRLPGEIGKFLETTVVERKGR